MMKIPCRECIVYAICRTKKYVECNKFYTIYEQAYYGQTAINIDQLFPNVISVGSEDGIAYTIVPNRRTVIEDTL